MLMNFAIKYITQRQENRTFLVAVTKLKIKTNVKYMYKYLSIQLVIGSH